MKGMRCLMRPRRMPSLLIALGGLLLLGTAPALLRAENRPADLLEAIVLSEPEIPATLPQRYRDLNAALTKGLAPQHNAAVPLARLLGVSPAFGPDELRMLGVKTFPARRSAFLNEKEYAATLETDEESQQKRVAALRDETRNALENIGRPGQFPELARYIALNEPVLDQLIQIAEWPRFYLPIVPDSDLVPEGGDWRFHKRLDLLEPLSDAGRALECRAVLRVARGEVQPALRDLLAVRQLSRLLAREAFSSTQFLVALRRTTTVHQVEAALLKSGRVGEWAKDYGTKLEQFSFSRSLIDCDEYEREWTLPEEIDRFRRRGVVRIENAASPLYSTYEDRPVKDLQRLDWDRVLQVARDRTARFSAAMRIESTAQRTAEFQRMRVEAKEAVASSGRMIRDLPASIERDPREAAERLGNHVANLYQPVADVLRETDDRARTRHNLSRAGFAAAACAQTHGRLPRTLQELTPEFLAEVPHDPYADGPLTFEVESRDRVRIWSWGPNRLDERGRPNPTAYPQPDDFVIDVSR